MGVFNSSDVFSEPYWYRVARGLVPGSSVIRKYGRITTNAATGFRTCWEYGSVGIGDIDYTYTADDSAPVTTMSSSDAGDTQSVRIEGVDGAGTFVSQTKSLNGQNKVTLDTPLNCAFRAYNDDTSAVPAIATAFAGGVYIYEDTPIVTGVPTDKSKIKAYVSAFNQTFQALYTIPLGYTGYLRWQRLAMERNKTASAGVHTWIRPFGKVFRNMDSNGIAGTGSNSVNESILIPSPIEERSIIVGRVDADTNGTESNIRFDILLVEND